MNYIYIFILFFAFIFLDYGLTSLSDAVNDINIDDALTHDVKLVYVSKKERKSRQLGTGVM